MGSKNCVPIPQWKNDCGSGYDKNECVHICRDGVMDVYKSLVDDNKDEPVKGSRKDNPTWAFRSTCAAMEPNPIVTGPNVVPVLNEVTGVIEYQITPAVDTDTVVTYLFEQTNPVNGDGIIVFTATPSDGGAPQEIELPEPTVDTDTNNDWTASALSPDGILTYTGTDGDGNPIAMPPVDLSALISPMLLAGTGISLDVDPNTGDITVNSTVVDTDTDTWDDVVAVQSTDPNTGVVTTTITVTPAEGGPDQVTTITSSVSIKPKVCDAGADRTVTSSDVLALSADTVKYDGSDPCVHIWRDCANTEVARVCKHKGGEQQQRIVFGVRQFINKSPDAGGASQGITTTASQSTGTANDGVTDFPPFVNPLLCPVRLTASVRFFDYNIMVRDPDGDIQGDEILGIRTWIEGFTGVSAHRAYLSLVPDLPFQVETVEPVFQHILLANSIPAGGSLSPTLNSNIAHTTPVPPSINIQNFQSMSAEITYHYEPIC